MGWISKKSKKTNTTFRLEDKRHKRFIGGVVISLILISAPFVFYVYRLAPVEPVWKINTWFGEFSMGSGGFPTVKTFLHSFLTKMMFLVFLTIWFFDSYKWWRFAILVPFGLFFYQLISLLNHKIGYTDNFNFWHVVPLLLPIVLLMIWISVKLNKDSQLLDLREQVIKEKQEINNNRRAV